MLVLEPNSQKPSLYSGQRIADDELLQDELFLWKAESGVLSLHTEILILSSEFVTQSLLSSLLKFEIMRLRRSS